MSVFQDKELTDSILFQMHRKVAALLRMPVAKAIQVTEAGQMEVTRMLEQPFAPVQPLTQWQAILVYPCTAMEDFFLGPTEEFKILRRNTPFKFLESALANFDVDKPFEADLLWDVASPSLKAVLDRKTHRTFSRGSRHFKLIPGGGSANSD